MRRKFLAAFSVLAAMITLASIGVSAQERSDESKVEQARLERKVRKEILTLPYYGVFDAIGFKIEGSKVTLSGFVTRPLNKDDAEDAVLDIDGIEKVVNNIEVLPPSPSDDRIRLKIYRSIQEQAGLYRYLLGANPSIRIIVNRGRVTLEGIVTYESDKILATRAATEIFGVFSVTNNLQVEKKKGERIG